MNIAVYAPFLVDNEFSEKDDFIVATFFLLLTGQTQKFFIITERGVRIPFPSNTKTVIVKPPSENTLLKRYWWDIKLPSTLSKIKAEFFISFDHNCSSNSPIPQCMVIQNTEDITAARVKKAQLLIVKSQSERIQLMQKYKVPAEKVAVVYAPASEQVKPINTEQKEDIKKRYSEDNEFFLCSGNSIREEDFVSLLKSFSHFKKRQQSSFKLLVITRQNSFLEKKLAGYKYSNDIKFVSPADKNDQSLIIAAAYALIAPFHSNEDIMIALNAMQAGVALITTQSSAIKEIADEAAMYAEEGSIKDMGEKMMQVYVDENYRSGLIVKGKARAEMFSPQKTAELLWQSIMKVL